MKLAFILIILFCFNCHGDNVEKFFRAINQVETGGRAGLIYGDKGRTLGPMQISKSYWEDSKTYGNYFQCTNYNYSCRVITNWMNRYNKKEWDAHNWEACARAHNSGPNWKNKLNKTDAYWRKVKRYLN